MQYRERGFTTPSIQYMLRSARKASGLTQADVAQHMGTTQSVISRAESLGGPDTTIAFLQRFAAATGQTLAPVIAARGRSAAMPAADVLRECRRLRMLARREGCAWIFVVTPEGWPDEPSTERLIQLIVRLRRGARGQDAIGKVTVAAERIFGRPVTVRELDSIQPATERARVYRSRRNLSAGLIAPPQPRIIAP